MYNNIKFPIGYIYIIKSVIEQYILQTLQFIIHFGYFWGYNGHQKDSKCVHFIAILNDKQ